MATFKGNAEMVLLFVIIKTHQINNSNYNNKQKAKEHETYRINI